MKRSKFSRFAWITFCFTLFVILDGAYVRASGSGAGCGRHWPLCLGSVFPHSPRIETLIEYTHRLTSGVALILVVILFVWSLKAFSKGHLVRKGTGFSLLFMAIEAIIGAFLVMYSLVAENVSVARTVIVALHLINSFLLMSSLALTAWWSGREPEQLEITGNRLNAMLLPGIAAVLVVVAAGGIAALASTLFASPTLGEGLAQDFSSSSPLLIRLRIWHPVLGALLLFYLLGISALVLRSPSQPTVKQFAWLLLAVAVLQFVVGWINLLLATPVWVQLLHLFLAVGTWIALVLLTASSAASFKPPATQSQAPR